MSEHRPENCTSHSKASTLPQFPVRRMRNTAVLVKWIEEHQSNPYPTKAEKQYLAYYSGMNLTQLSTWFANARRRIKKIGMKTWLEGRSTFTVDFFPTSATLQPSRADSYGSAYANPYASAYTTLSNYPTQHHTATIGLPNRPTSVYTSDASSLYQSGTNAASINGLYSGAAQRSLSQPLVGMSALTNWAAMPSAFTSIPTTSTVSLQPRLCNSTGSLPSPLTAQAYSVGTMGTESGQSALEVNDGSYSLSQASPEHMLPECASTEPILQRSPKTHYQSQTE